jgi:RHS repeat-associated protein
VRSAARRAHARHHPHSKDTCEATGGTGRSGPIAASSTRAGPRYGARSTGPRAERKTRAPRSGRGGDGSTGCLSGSARSRRATCRGPPIPVPASKITRLPSSGSYFHARGVASNTHRVSGLADGGGNLVGSRSYGAFGASRTTTGTTSLFGFSGEPTDATDLVHLRARYLDTAIGRFLSADSFFRNMPGTQGYNLYTYVANNPVTWVDPSGHLVFALEGLHPIALFIIIVFLSLALFLMFQSFREVWLKSGAEAALQEALKDLIDRAKRTWKDLKEWWQREPENPIEECIKRLICLPPPGRLPVFKPGADTPDTTDHIMDALLTHPEWLVLTRAQHPDTTTNREWYEGDPRCPSVLGDEITCDEYPFFTTRRGGPPHASLRNVPGWEQDKHGGYLKNFYGICGILIGEDYRVEPNPEAPKTVYDC